MAERKARNQGDCVLVVKHAGGEAIFGPLFYRHTDRAKNVHDMKRRIEMAGYECRQELLYQAATFESFAEACPPEEKV
jgi:hypothetical protein